MRRRRAGPRRAWRGGGLGVVALLAASTIGCGSGSSSVGQSSLRLGYLANLTNAPALVGLDHGIIQHDLGGVGLRAESFNAGPAAVEALFGGAIDAAYLGPNAAINAFTRSRGAAVRIVSGATAGGAALVVRSGVGIGSAADLRGRLVATPQLGNTQDVALRAWLDAHGLHTDPHGGGDVRVAPAENPTILQLFEQHRIDAAWVPEPWASRLVDEAQGRRLVDEATLWPQGRFATTELVVSERLVEQRPALVRALVRGNLDTLAWMAANPDAARASAAAALARLGGRSLSPRVLEDAWSRLHFTPDPLAGALQHVADEARRLGLLGGSDLRGIVDVRELNTLLGDGGRRAVDTAGLGAG